MLKFYKTENDKLIEITEIESGCWVNVVKPNQSEIDYLINEMKIEEQFVNSSLDTEEMSRVEVEDEQTLVILDIPIKCEEEENNTVIYNTIPIGIIMTEDHIITISTAENEIIDEIKNNKIKNLQTQLKTRFFLMILIHISVKYLYFLRQIEKISATIERQLHKSMKNQELLQLIGLEKSLVYFSTSLKANEIILQKILKGRVIKLYEDDHDVLEDVLIEVKQAIEMSNIYASILSGTMNAFASVISNNLNIVMKVLTSITIVMSIPNIIFSFYGMNVKSLPMANFWFPMLASLSIMGLCFGILKKKNMI